MKFSSKRTSNGFNLTAMAASIDTSAPPASGTNSGYFFGSGKGPGIYISDDNTVAGSGMITDAVAGKSGMDQAIDTGGTNKPEGDVNLGEKIDDDAGALVAGAKTTDMAIGQLNT